MDMLGSTDDSRSTHPGCTFAKSGRGVKQKTLFQDSNKVSLASKFSKGFDINMPGHSLSRFMYNLMLMSVDVEEQKPIPAKCPNGYPDIPGC